MSIKINKKGFYCPSDTTYFNQWTKLFIASSKKHAPWAHIHVHIFDAVDNDFAWCKKHNISITSEITPKKYTTDDMTKKGYWVTSRFIKLPEIYDDNTSVIAIDSDSLFKNDLLESVFDRDLKNSWATIRGKDNKSLGSAIGFGPDNARHVFRDKLVEHKDNLRWWLDQEILDEMLSKNQIGQMNLKYSDFTVQDESIIWTGKGQRKFKKGFAKLADSFREKE